MLTKTLSKLQMESGIAHVKVAPGVMTDERFWMLYRETVRDLQGRPAPEVFVADFRAPLWVLNEHALNEHLEGARPAVAVPAALIVTPAAYELFRGHAWSVAQAGILRKVFTDPAQARAWALGWQARERAAHSRRTAP